MIDDFVVFWRRSVTEGIWVSEELSLTLSFIVKDAT